MSVSSTLNERLSRLHEELMMHLAEEEEHRIARKAKRKKRKMEEKRAVLQQEWENTERDHTMVFEEMVQYSYVDPQAVQVIEKSILAPHIGRAVIANRDFAPGDVVCSYGGNILNKDDIDAFDQAFDENDPRGAYIVNVEHDEDGNGILYVDGYPSLLSVEGHVGNFINDSRGIDGAQVNCCIASVYDNSGRICYLLIEANTEIAKGQELWLSYGEKYWKEKE